MKSFIKNISLIFILLLSFVSSADSQKADKSNVGGSLYFPLQISDVKKEVDDKMDDFRNRWYSRHLASMKEPVLFDKTDENIKVFRYTNLASFSNPFTIRVELKDSIVTFNYKLTDGKGGYGPGKIIKEYQKQLPAAEWNRILSKVESSHFWEMHTYRSNPNGMLLDGAEWIFEALLGSKYHFVTRNSPETEGDKEYASLCNLMYEYFLVIDKGSTRKIDPHLVNIKLKL
jgi:hypothetical protein